MRIPSIRNIGIGSLLLALSLLKGSIELVGLDHYDDENGVGYTSQALSTSQQHLSAVTAKSSPKVDAPDHQQHVQQLEQREDAQTASVTAKTRASNIKLQESGKTTCPSHYRNKNNKNEHSPLIFKRNNLVVCRSPKVGSNELRAVATAYDTKMRFVPPSANVPYKGSILANVKSSKAFNRYLYSNGVTRIMFVRHPVERILSAFLQTARGKLFWNLHGFQRNKGATPKTFRQWVLDEKLFYKYYHSTCNENSTEADIHYKIQHWAPPQHCRCGIHDCRVEWQVYKIEENSVQSVLKQHLPQKYLPPANTSKILHKREYSKEDFLTTDVLGFLNTVTKEERDFFGYPPLTLNDL